MPARRCSSMRARWPPTSASISSTPSRAADRTATSPRRTTATLDGLGVDGKGAHTHYEQMYLSSIEPRARLLHRLFQTLR